MRNIWNPWHGCIKKSEGCANCYMFFLDKQRNRSGANIYKVKNNFDYPIAKDKNGFYKVTPGSYIYVCLTSDFFLKEADTWRDEAWEIIKARPDVVFFILTKRPERVLDNLPKDWGDGWENVFFNVTCENQDRADERIPILFSLPFKHKGIMVAPFLTPISLKKYLNKNQIEQVLAGGENYEGARPLDYDWVKSLYKECVRENITFSFLDIGMQFVKDGKTYCLKDKRLRHQMAKKSNLQFSGKEISFKLKSITTDLFNY